MFDGRDWIALGTITDVSRDDDHGLVAVVALLDGGDRDEVEARFLWTTPGDGSGVYAPVEVGAQVVVGFPHGDRNGSVVLGFPGSHGARPPSAWGNDVSAVYAAGGRHEVRSADNASAAVEGVVLAPLLDDLATLTTALSALVTALTNPATPPGTAVQNAAILTAMRTAADLPSVGLKAVLTSLQTALDTSKANSGQAPHASAVLRAALS